MSGEGSHINICRLRVPFTEMSNIHKISFHNVDIRLSPHTHDRVDQSRRH